MAQGVFQALLNILLILGRLHVNEVDHDQTTQVTQTHLASQFVGSF